MSSIVVAGDSSGSITLQAPAVAGSTTLTLPTASGTVVATDSVGNVGIGTTNPTQKIQGAISSAGGFPATSGTSQPNAVLRLNTSNAGTCLDFGVDGVTTAASWIQATAQNNLATNWSLALNPNGGNVGIGTTSPASKLHVEGNLTLCGYGVVQASNSTTGISILGGNQPNGINSGGQINLRGTVENRIEFLTSNNTERMRIDSSGNVGINTTSPGTFGKFAIQVDGTTNPTSLATVGPSSINLYAAGYGGITNSTTGVFGWNSAGGLGSGIGFSRESSNDWGTQVRFYTHPTTTTSLEQVTERMRIDSSGNVTLQKNISVGGAAPATSGTGITFPATQSASSDANTLDDYEEGTFSPTMTIGGTAVVTYYLQAGTYTRIGNIVNFCIRISGNNLGAGTGQIAVLGLPFTADNTVGVRPIFTALNDQTNTYAYSYAVGNTTTILTGFTNATYTAGYAIGISGFYKI